MNFDPLFHLSQRIFPLNVLSSVCPCNKTSLKNNIPVLLWWKSDLDHGLLCVGVRRQSFCSVLRGRLTGFSLDLQPVPRLIPVSQPDAFILSFLPVCPGKFLWLSGVLGDVNVVCLWDRLLCSLVWPFQLSAKKKKKMFQLVKLWRQILFNLMISW